MEKIGGILILLKRTRIIGCLFTSTILINVIIQDIYFGIPSGALKAAILYEFLVITILWLNKDKLIKSLKILLKPKEIEQPKMHFWTKLIIAFLLFIVFRIFEYYITLKW